MPLSVNNNLSKWFTENKNSLQQNILEVLMNQAAQHPLFPCCSGLFLRMQLNLNRNLSQPLTNLLHEMEQSQMIIIHSIEGVPQSLYRIHPKCKVNIRVIDQPIQCICCHIAPAAHFNNGGFNVCNGCYENIKQSFQTDISE